MSYKVMKHILAIEDDLNKEGWHYVTGSAKTVP